MTITSTSAIDKLNAGTKKTTTTTSNDKVDQNTFLKLLTTQMKNQDPFNPVDNTQMVAQMAQFSSVAGIAEMNSSLKTIATDLAASRVGDASGWIGRSALVSSNKATQFSDGSYAGEITLPSDAKNVSISLVDSGGQTVYAETLGAQSAGAFSFQWNGKNENGEQVGSGPLTVRVTAVDDKGTITPSVSTWTYVSGVQSPATGTSMLVTPLGLIAPSDAERLS